MNYSYVMLHQFSYANSPQGVCIERQFTLFYPPLFIDSMSFLSFAIAIMKHCSAMTPLLSNSSILSTLNITIKYHLDIGSAEYALYQNDAVVTDRIYHIQSSFIM